LSKKEGKLYDLPTEAEWEYACRAKTTTRFFPGDDADSLLGYANAPDATAAKKFPDWTCLGGDDGYVFTAPVGKFKPNAWGLYDMHGNAWEWCADSYGPYDAGPVTDPRRDEAGTERVLRGGSFYKDCNYCRSAYRYRAAPSTANVNYGFRV